MMNILNNFGLSFSDDTKRLDSGQAKVYGRTIGINEDVIAIENIGTVRIIDGTKSPAATIWGIIIAVIGLTLLSSSLGFGFLVMILGIALAVWNIMREIEVYLSMNTCDGKSTIIVSKNKQFLKEVRDFLREKIETKNQIGATINISNSKLEGTFAIGDGATAESYK